MTERYYVEEPIAGDRVTLSGAEAHHLLHVMRAEAGMRVTLFDGSGDQFEAVVERVGRADATLSVLSRQTISRELPFDLILGVALPKGERQKWLVEKAVELGVTRLVPLQTRRTIAQPTGQTLARLGRTVVEASKQCGRNRLLQIDQPRTWPDFVGDAAGASCRLVAHQKTEGESKSERNGLSEEVFMEATLLPSPRGLSHQFSVCLAVGPEGGFTEEEIALAVSAGWRVVDLGSRTLRVETAALMLSAVIASSITTLSPPRW